MATASFSKNKSSQRSRVLQIPGTKPSLFNHQLLVSSGVPSFDNLLGGGIAVGSLVLIGKYISCYLLSCIMLIGGLKLSFAKEYYHHMSHELPKPIVDDVTPAQSNMMQTDEMKIAWRYQHLNKYQSNPTTVKFGHYYDLSQYMDEDLVSSADVTLITSQQLSQQHLHVEPPGIEPKNLEVSACLQCLLLNIQQHIQDGQFGTQDQPEKHNVLRIAIPSLGSPLWGNLKTSESDGLLSVVDTDLLRFLLALRAILRSSFAVCMVTVPSLIMEDANFIHKIERLCDTVVHLESFAGSSRSENPLYKEYHGLFHVKQLPKLNAIRCQMPDTTDWAFKLRRKKFVIEKLHLPPDLSETVSRSESRPGIMGCGSTGHRHLDF
ncbi:elongator complex protein 4 [Octopus bimaculoides]|nr:elongator complex protein 4 [Octopus bimaculoides]